MRTQTNGDEIVFICGRRQREESERIMSEVEYEETDSATVVLPTVREGGPANLPGKTSLFNLSEGTEIVRKWLSGD